MSYYGMVGDMVIAKDSESKCENEDMALQSQLGAKVLLVPE